MEKRLLSFFKNKNAYLCKEKKKKKKVVHHSKTNEEQKAKPTSGELWSMSAASCGT